MFREDERQINGKINGLNNGNDKQQIDKID